MEKADNGSFDEHLRRSRADTFAHRAGRHALSTEFQETEPQNTMYERIELDPTKILVTKADSLTSPSENLWLNEDENARLIATGLSGKISLIERLRGGKLSEKQLDDALGAVKNYIVRAWHNARARCVDGRVLEGYDESREQMRDRDLGTQVPGGTAGEALCDRLATGPDKILGTFFGMSIEQDVEQYVEQVQLMGFELGGHTDDHAPEGKTGCGAVDRMPEILQNMTRPAYVRRLTELTQAIMGQEAYDDKIFSEIMGNALRLQSEAEAYFKEYRQTIFVKIKQQASQAIAKLVGTHNEVAVIVNRVYGTTFNRDEFSADTNHQLQAFNYDYWSTVESVETLMGASKRFSELSSDNRRLREAQKVLTARVMYAVATLMTLTDGSLRLIVLDEIDSTSEVGDKQREDKVINLFDNFGRRKKCAPVQILPRAA